MGWHLVSITEKERERHTNVISDPASVPETANANQNASRAHPYLGRGSRLGESCQRERWVLWELEHSLLGRRRERRGSEGRRRLVGEVLDRLDGVDEAVGGVGRRGVREVRDVLRARERARVSVKSLNSMMPRIVCFRVNLCQWMAGPRPGSTWSGSDT